MQQEKSSISKEVNFACDRVQTFPGKKASKKKI